MAVTKSKSVKSTKIRTPLYNNVNECLKSLRSHPKLSKALARTVPIQDVFEVESSGSKCVVIYIKAYILKAMRKILVILRSECEKKLGKQVYFIGYRRIIPKPMKRSALAKVHRPYRRTVTGVHESILEDLVFPGEIVGKRVLYRPGFGKVMKVFLDLKNKAEMEKRVKSLSDVYKRITCRESKFEFPLYDYPTRVLKLSREKK